VRRIERTCRVDSGRLAANFNNARPGDLSRGASMPEPAGLGLIGLAGLRARRRRR
jgi:MYXO-CTERM domain-containing protein